MLKDSTPTRWMAHCLLVGSGSQIANFMPSNIHKVSARQWFQDGMPLSRDYEVILFVFGENRTFLFPTESNKQCFEHVNIDLSLQAAQRAKDKCKRAVFFGTAELWSKCQGAVYPQTPEKAFDSLYIQSKSIMRDKLMQLNLSETRIVHPFNFNSMHRKGDYLFGKIFKSIASREKITIFDTYFERDIVSPLHVSNTALDPDLPLEVLVGSGKTIKVNCLIREMYRAANLRFEDLVTEDLSAVSARRGYVNFSGIDRDNGAGCDIVSEMKNYAKLCSMSAQYHSGK